jgi:hypothetical protein
MDERAHDPHALLTLQFLRWVGEDGRSHAETMEAWRSSCPRLSVWEDSLEAGLVTVMGGTVALAAAGRALLARDSGDAHGQPQGRVCGVAS